jgi:predicted kinase
LAYLIVLQGPTGIGKSTIANALAKELQTPVIDKDDIKDIIDDSFTDTKVSGWLSYEAMWRVAEKQLINGLSVICDSPLTGATNFQNALEIAQRNEAKLVIVDCACSKEEVWRERIEGRATDPSHPNHKARTWEEAQSNIRGYARTEAKDAIKIDTADNLEANLCKILSAISGRARDQIPPCQVEHRVAVDWQFLD